MAEEVFGFSRRRWTKLANENVYSYQRKKHEGIAATLRSMVRLLSLRDDVSRNWKKANGDKRK